MQFLSLENVSKSYGEKILFKNVTISVSKGDKIALVAKNGSGKTTLLRVIAGMESGEGEQSKIFISKDIKTAFLLQDPQLHEHFTVQETIFDSNNEAITAIRDYEKALLTQNETLLHSCVSRMDDLKAWDLESKVKEVLHKLLLTNMDQKVKEMSGGQRKRLALAKILIEEPDFLVLDEPTNHLDIEMIEWLENYLQQPGITLFMVTHDRYFLDNVCNEILELDSGEVFLYKGNYAQFLEKKEARLANNAANLDKNRKLFQRELEWMRRMPQARTTKAKSRIDDFYDIKDKITVRKENENLNLQIQSSRLGSKVVELHNVSKKYGEKSLVNAFTYKFKHGEKVGIVGPNGAGKSTLLKLITKSIDPDMGKVIHGDTVVFGYYTQEGLVLNTDKTVLDVIRDIADYIPLDKGQKISAEAMLERFLFPRHQQRVYVSQLSGGERRRLYLLTVLMRNPNFLILDEPTNDLDILTLNILEDYLLQFSGCVVVVTHDRYFMDRIADHLFVLEGNGNLKDYNGTHSEYRTLLKNNIIAANASMSSTDSSEKSQSQGKISYEQRKEFARLEKDIKKLEERKAEITEKFNSSELDSDTIMKLSTELDQIQNQISEKEESWLELAELMENG
ncbi:MAG: ABC-F family ATP-binding cassette domain-containing protein [Saprospiraceae bacterium]